jgi:cytochrome c peroxidase
MLSHKLPTFVFFLLGIVVFQSEDQTRSAPMLSFDSLPKELELKKIPLGFSRRPVLNLESGTTELTVELGRRLFFDPILSGDGRVACASCHRPEFGMASEDKLAVGIGGRTGKRNVPTVFNRGYGEHFSWDGRIDSLEEQVLAPIVNPDELGNDLSRVIDSIKAHKSYVNDFSEVFGDGGESDRKWVTRENLAAALASFVRSLLYGDTRVDHFRAGDYSKLSRSARQGMWIFESRGGCWKCHGGENFTDESFHNTGVSCGHPDRDLGRYAHTGVESDRFKFKTPTLRGIALTAPYMHDGSLQTLKEVVQFYNRGGGDGDPDLDADLKPLQLSPQEEDYLVEFLLALSQDETDE